MSRSATDGPSGAVSGAPGKVPHMTKMTRGARRAASAVLTLLFALGLGLTGGSPTYAAAPAVENFKRPAVVENFKRVPVENFKIGPFAARAAASSCDPGFLCLWQAKDRGGRSLMLSASKVRPGHSLDGYFLNNRVSSVENNTGSDVILIGNIGCNPPAMGGWGLWINNGAYYADLSSSAYNRQGQSANDRISCVNS